MDKFVLYLDIMGFKERVNRTSIEELEKQLLFFKTKNNKLKPHNEVIFIMGLFVIRIIGNPFDKVAEIGKQA
jgi:hypothetical protein